jgi:hypothetical protein
MPISQLKAKCFFFSTQKHAVLSSLPRVFQGVYLADFKIFVLVSKTRGFKNMSFDYIIALPKNVNLPSTRFLRHSQHREVKVIHLVFNKNQNY